MQKLLAVAIVAAISTPAFAAGPQATSTAVGVGTGIAASKSQSTAVAVSGQGGKGVGVGTGGNPTSNVTIQGTQVPTSTTSTINNEGTSTVKNVPSVFAPGLAAAGLETCLGSVSGGGSFVGTGFSFGSTIPDPGCGARLDARTLWSMGLKKAAVARLCLNPDIYASMPEVCVAYLPQRQTVAYAAAGPNFQWPSFGRAAVVPSIAPEDNGGPVEVILARTGEHRVCKDYDAVKHRCHAWVR